MTQPPETDPPQAVSPRPAPARRIPARRLLVVLLVCGMLSAAGVGTSFVFLSQQDSTDRSTPTVVVIQFLQAALRDQDDHQVERLTCAQWTPDRTEFLRGRAGPGATYQWSAIVEQSRTRQQAQVTAELAVKYPGQALPSSMQRWRFGLVNDDGWRVCTAEPA